MKRNRTFTLVCALLAGFATSALATLTLNLQSPVLDPAVAGVLPTDTEIWFTGTFTNDAATAVDIAYGDFAFDAYNSPAWATSDRVLYGEQPGGLPPSLMEWIAAHPVLDPVFPYDPIAPGYVRVLANSTSASYTLFGVLIAGATLTNDPQTLQGWYQVYDYTTLAPLLTDNALLGPLLTVDVIPEPASLALLGLGLLGLIRRPRNVRR